MGKVRWGTPRYWYAAWQRHSPHERQLFCTAFCWLGLMRLLVLLLPFQWLLLGLRLRPCPAPTLLGANDMDDTVVLISRAVQAASVYTPWRSNCLAQALAAHYMLRRRRLPCTLYIGVAKRPGQSLTAHAWLGCGTYFVTGEKGWQQFTPITYLENGRV